MVSNLYRTWYGYRVDVVAEHPNKIVIARKRFFNIDYLASIEAHYYAQFGYRFDPRVKAYWRE